MEVATCDELIDLINFGKACRSTASTGVHDASSRSHAILRIFINHCASESKTGVPTKSQEGILNLIDLAGSEHRIDSMYHSASRRKEGAFINASLMALKDCIRAKAESKNGTHHYRRSKLTMALKTSFLFPTARTVIIATVSPASKDTEHSLNTLRHACIMDGQETGGPNGETRYLTAGVVTTIEIGSVDIAALAKKNFVMKKKGIVEDIKTSNGNDLNKNTNDDDLTDKEKSRLQKQAVRTALKQLRPDVKALLLHAQKNLGQNIQQRMRLRISQFPNLQAQTCDSDGSEGDQNTGIVAASMQGQDQVQDKETESKLKRTCFKKLYKSVYGTNNRETVPEALLRRQFITLLRLHGYDDDEVQRIAPPSPTDVFLQQSKPKKSPDHSNSLLNSKQVASSPGLASAEAEANLSNRLNAKFNKAASGGSISSPEHRELSNREKILADALAVVEKDSFDRRSRHDLARAKRELLEQQQRDARMAKLKATEASTSASLIDKDSAVHENAIVKLVNDLQDTSISAAVSHGIKQQIAKHRAAILKLKRAKSQDQREDLNTDHCNSTSPRIQQGGTQGNSETISKSVITESFPPSSGSGERTSSGAPAVKRSLRRQTKCSYGSSAIVSSRDDGGIGIVDAVGEGRRSAYPQSEQFDGGGGGYNNRDTSQLQGYGFAKREQERRTSFNVIEHCQPDPVPDTTKKNEFGAKSTVSREKKPRRPQWQDDF